MNPPPGIPMDEWVDELDRALEAQRWMHTLTGRMDHAVPPEAPQRAPGRWAGRCGVHVWVTGGKAKLRRCERCVQYTTSVVWWRLWASITKDANS